MRKGLSEIMIDIIENAIKVITNQSKLIERHGFSEDAEEADDAQRIAHAALNDLARLKSQLEAGELVSTANAA